MTSVIHYHYIRIVKSGNVISFHGAAPLCWVQAVGHIVGYEERA